MKAILDVEDLTVDFYRKGVRTNSPIRGISFSIERGKTLGLVGETGCGKTLTGLSILGLLPDSAVRGGHIRLDGIGELTRESLNGIRGSDISFIFQNPHSAFNPVFTIERQLLNVAYRHGLDKKQSEIVIRDRLDAVGLSDIDRVLHSYPYQLSGGMLQRCMISMALLGEPKLLIADEPTTALDATIARQILGLILQLQKRYGFSLIFISHNVGLVSDIADEIAILYAGRIVEKGPTQKVLRDPKHPYTLGLLNAIPSAQKKPGHLTAIPGQVPANTTEITGCAFASRCSKVMAVCSDDPILEVRDGREVACWVIAND